MASIFCYYSSSKPGIYNTFTLPSRFILDQLAPFPQIYVGQTKSSEHYTKTSTKPIIFRGHKQMGRQTHSVSHVKSIWHHTPTKHPTTCVSTTKNQDIFILIHDRWKNTSVMCMAMMTWKSTNLHKSPKMGSATSNIWEVPCRLFHLIYTHVNICFFVYSQANA